MRKLTIATLLAASLALPAQAETIHVGVNGLICAFCVKGIESNFKKNDAVETVKVEMDEKLVTVTTKKGTTLDDASITQIITNAGYNVTTIHHQE